MQHVTADAVQQVLLCWTVRDDLKLQNQRGGNLRGSTHPCFVTSRSHACCPCVLW